MSFTEVKNIQNEKHKQNMFGPVRFILLKLNLNCSLEITFKSYCLFNNYCRKRANLMNFSDKFKLNRI